ncbi:hypothetical protein EDB85DRAFT_239055 [Lactarius pseudohatsudake]|nr:hypothetical protein EDB85DRAFT_239055 [Lactarius pseudohatsudake]
MTIYLPFEIVTAIFEEIDDVRDIWHIRTVSRTLSAAATPFAFRILSVISTKGSAQNLGRLFDVPDIAAHVREVTFHDTDTDRKGRALKSSAVHELASSFSRFHQLPRLETINLTFYPGYGNRLDGGSLALQSSVLGALASSFSVRVPKLMSLSLHNLRIWDLSPLESPSFQTVLTTLRRFQLSVLFFDGTPDSDTDFERWCNFCTLCPRMILAPMQHSLTELTFHSDANVGALSGLSFAGLHFPRLCALSLRMVIFEPSVGAKQFILRHATTLARLELLVCKLPVDPNIFLSPSPTAHARDESGSEPDSWERIWDRFAAELTALVALNVDERRSDRWGRTNSEFRYVRPDLERMTYRETYTFTHRNAADAAALRCFHLTVATRSEEARGES